MAGDHAATAGAIVRPSPSTAGAMVRARWKCTAPRAPAWSLRRRGRRSDIGFIKKSRASGALRAPRRRPIRPSIRSGARSPDLSRDKSTDAIAVSSHGDGARWACSREPGAAWPAVRAVRDVPLAGEQTRKSLASLSENQPRDVCHHAASGPCYPTRRP
jgi:hypothetical protein